MTQARLIVAAVLLLAGFAAGATVATWRANVALAKAQTDHLVEVRRLEQLQAELEAKIAEQNKAVELMAARAAGAEQARQVAERSAADEAQRSADRMTELEQQTRQATTAGQVLLRYWEMAR